MQSAITAPFAILVVVLLTLATPPDARAQSAVDEQQVFLARIQADEREVVLQSMGLDDRQIAAFTPIYDAYQVEYKRIMDRAVALIESYASSYGSMTDETAAHLLKDWFALKRDEDALIRAYARKMGRVLPPAKVLRFVQIENKVSTTLRLSALRNIPLVK